MPTFRTPEPITAVVEIVAGAVHLASTDRDDTVVDVTPRDPERASDVRAAEQARVDFHNGNLVVTAGRKVLSLGRGERSASTSPCRQVRGSTFPRHRPTSTPTASTRTAAAPPRAARYGWRPSPETSRRTAHPAIFP